MCIGINVEYYTLTNKLQLLLNTSMSASGVIQIGDFSMRDKIIYD